MAIDRDASLHTQAFYIVGGIFTSVGLIIINKVIMQYYGFGYVLTLTSMHFWFSAIALWLYSYFWKPIINTQATTKDVEDSDVRTPSTSSASPNDSTDTKIKLSYLKSAEATTTQQHATELSTTPHTDDKLSIRFASDGKTKTTAFSRSNSGSALTQDTQPILPSRSVQFKVAFANVASIVLSNFSLQTNSVGFYQIWKMLCIPCTVALSFYFLGKSVSNKIKLSLFILLVGVSIATVTDVDLNITGTVFGTLAVLSTSVGHIWLANVQKSQRLSGLQAYYIFVPIQALMCTVLTLAFEIFTSIGVQPAKATGTVISIWSHEFHLLEVGLLVLSSAMALASNIFGTTLMGITSALTFEVVSHAKTCLIFLLWFIVFPLPPTKQLVKILCGIVIAFAGMLLYGYFKKHENGPTSANSNSSTVTSNSSSQQLVAFLSKLDRLISDILDRDDEEDRDSPVSSSSGNNTSSTSSSNPLFQIFNQYSFNSPRSHYSTNAIARLFSRYKFVVGVIVTASVLVFLFTIRAQRVAVAAAAESTTM